jgi:hypothetical protein
VLHFRTGKESVAIRVRPSEKNASFSPFCRRPVGSSTRRWTPERYDKTITRGTNGKTGHKLSLEENATMKYCDNYKYLWTQINEDGRRDSWIQERIDFLRHSILTMNCTVGWRRLKKEHGTQLSTVVPTLIRIHKQTIRPLDKQNSLQYSFYQGIHVVCKYSFLKNCPLVITVYFSAALLLVEY